VLFNLFWFNICQVFYLFDLSSRHAFSYLFADENRLLAAVRPLEEKIESPEELERNVNSTHHDLFNVSSQTLGNTATSRKVSNEDINLLVLKSQLFNTEYKGRNSVQFSLFCSILADFLEFVPIRLEVEDLCASLPNFNKRFRK
jgi:hypothetical protein